MTSKKRHFFFTLPHYLKGERIGHLAHSEEEARIALAKMCNTKPSDFTFLGCEDTP